MPKNSRGAFAKGIGYHTGKHDIGDCQGVLHPVLFTGYKGDQFGAVAQQVADLADICRGNEAAGNQAVLVEVRNPDRILFISLLAADRLDILGMCQGDPAGRFQDVVDGNPVLAGGLHADMHTLMI